MAVLEPLSLSVTGDLTCATCDEPVTGILLPISARLRPRANPEASEIVADVVIDHDDVTLQPCGHPYPSDELPSRRMLDEQPPDPGGCDRHHDAPALEG